MPNFYVAVDGDDRWSGTRARPFATLQAARDAVRALRRAGGLKTPVTVYLREGTHFLGKPFCLKAGDSGTPECPITYAAFDGERPVISGGTRVEDWEETKLEGKRVWRAVLPDVAKGKWYFRQLFVDGARRQRARLPKKGYFRVAGLPDTTPETPWNEGQTRFECEPGDVRAWHNLQDVELCALHLWAESHLPIADVDEQTQIVEVGKRSVFRLTQDHSWAGSRYYIEGVREALSEPGEWYLDRHSGELWYKPARGERPEDTQVIAPRLPQLVRLEGTARQPVKHVHFEGITFCHTDWWLDQEQSGTAQAAIIVPAAICAENATACRIDNCDICHTGTYAVEMGQGCNGNFVTHCRMHDLGAGGVKMNHGSAFTTVSDCEIHHGGRIFHSAVGVWIGQSSDNQVIHNDIHDLFYSGVSVGWSWGYAPSTASRNVIDFNHIHHLGFGMLSDMGGVYTLGDSPGTRVCNNLIHDVASDTYGGWGLYTDEGSTGILLSHNVVYNTKTGGFHQHYGKENLIQNNIFAFDQSNMVVRSRNEAHVTLSFQRNIVLINNGRFLGGNWDDGTYRIDHNLYWDVRGPARKMGPATIKQWQKRGNDEHSVFADPRFVAPARGDFTLKPDSPARLIGFQPIDLSRVGPRT